MTGLVDILRGFKRKPEPPRLCTDANVDALLNRSGPKDGDPVVGRPELKFREFEATYDADNDGVWASDKVFLPRAAILNMMVVLMQNAPTERPHPETIRETWVNDNAAETPQ
tara:strand:+ start:1432 stop:1767 length:336 start_codon:yes stop_codon:yes gene_type:complete